MRRFDPTELYNPTFADSHPRLFARQLRPENCFTPTVALENAHPLDAHGLASRVATWHTALWSFIDAITKGSLVDAVWHYERPQGVADQFRYLGADCWQDFLDLRGLFDGCSLYRGRDGAPTTVKMLLLNPVWLSGDSHRDWWPDASEWLEPVAGTPRRLLIDAFGPYIALDTKAEGRFQFENPLGVIVRGDTPGDLTRRATLLADLAPPLAEPDDHAEPSRTDAPCVAPDGFSPALVPTADVLDILEPLYRKRLTSEKPKRRRDTMRDSAVADGLIWKRPRTRTCFVNLELLIARNQTAAQKIVRSEKLAPLHAEIRRLLPDR